MSTTDPNPTPKKRRDYQDGQERVRKDLWPDLPDGYKRGSNSGTGFVHITIPVCEACGAAVIDTDRHDGWHQSITSIGSIANRADMMTNVIGPKVGAPDV